MSPGFTSVLLAVLVREGAVWPPSMVTPVSGSWMSSRSGLFTTAVLVMYSPWAPSSTVTRNEKVLVCPGSTLSAISFKVRLLAL